MVPSTARVMAAELRKLTDRPVRYVVTTHWHDDHHGGNEVYRELWPGVEFVAHRDTREDILAQTYAPRPKEIADLEAQAKKYGEVGRDRQGRRRQAARAEPPQAGGRDRGAGPRARPGAARDPRNPAGLHVHRPARAAPGRPDDRDPLARPRQHARRRRGLPAEGAHRRDGRPLRAARALRHRLVLRGVGGDARKGRCAGGRRARSGPRPRPARPGVPAPGPGAARGARRTGAGGGGRGRHARGDAGPGEARRLEDEIRRRRHDQAAGVRRLLRRSGRRARVEAGQGGAGRARRAVSAAEPRARS